MREFEKLPLSSSLSSSSSASAFSTSTSELKQCNKNNKSKGKGKGRDEQDSSPLTVSENLHLPRHEHLPEAIANFLESSEDMDIARYGYEYGYGCGGDTDAADDDAASGDTVHKKNIYFSNDDGDDDEEPPSQALKYYVLLMLQKQVELRNQNIGSELGDVGSTSASTASRPLAIDFIIDDTAVTSIAIAMQEVAAMVMRGKEKEVEEAMRELDLL